MQPREYFENLQQSIVASLQKFETAKFTQDPWISKLGKGVTAITEYGDVFDRAGVGFSVKGLVKLSNSSVIPMVKNRKKLARWASAKSPILCTNSLFILFSL